MSPTTRHCDKATLCRDGIFRQSSVVGLDRDYELSAVPDEDLRVYLQNLLREIQQSSDPALRRAAQRELDSYLFAVALLGSGEMAGVPIELLRLPTDLSWTPTYDMGAVIREIVVGQVGSKSVMTKIVQYCLPYIKHNRLNFPDMHTLTVYELQAMVQFMAAMCLGAYEHAQRKCTWSNRVRLFWLFWQLMHGGSAQDMFVFCRTHMSMLRLSIIEYFVWFITRFMPTELLFMDRILGLNAGVQHVFKQFTVIVDNFRQLALQDASIDIALVNAKAQTSIDKCNRLCKGKSRCVQKHNQATAYKYSTLTAMRSMHMPRMQSAMHVQCYDPSVAPEEALDIVRFQRLIDVFPMPYNLQRTQAQAIVALASHNTRAVYQSTFLYYCLKCQDGTPKGITCAKMRVRGNRVSCAQCGHHEALLKIQMAGRFVRIHTNTFYYCHVCLQVHNWQVGSSSIDRCVNLDEPPRRIAMTTQCRICQRNTSAPPIEVLDDELGLAHTLVLCPAHRPPAHEQHMVHNLAELVYYFDAGRRYTCRR